jgi:hypothetical protein
VLATSAITKTAPASLISVGSDCVALISSFLDVRSRWSARRCSQVASWGGHSLNVSPFTSKAASSIISHLIEIVVKLKTVVANRTNITVACLSDLTSLQSLDLSQCDELTGAGLSHPTGELSVSLAIGCSAGVQSSVVRHVTRDQRTQPPHTHLTHSYLSPFCSLFNRKLLHPDAQNPSAADRCLSQPTSAAVPQVCIY